MKNDHILDAIGTISDEAIQDAKAYQQSKKKKPVWVKWGVVAACLALVVAIGIPFISDFIAPKSGPGQDDPLRPVNAIEYNGAYYEIVDMEDTQLLNRYNLPHEITDDIVGSPLGSGLDANGKSTKETFYIYTPYMDIRTDPEGHSRVQRAVYVIKDEVGKYSFALFCNFVGFDSNTHIEASEMFVVYGIDAADDIAYIEVGENKISDAEKINAIFDTICNSSSLGNDDYQKLIFGNMGEEEQQKLSTELADDMVEIKITSNEGIVTNSLCYYPSINYIYWGLSYYKLNNPID